MFVLNLLVDAADKILYVISGLRHNVRTVQRLLETSALIGRRSAVVVVVVVARTMRNQPQSDHTRTQGSCTRYRWALETENSYCRRRDCL